MSQLSLDLAAARHPRTLARVDDPVTSRLAAFGQRRRGVHLERVLRAYADGEALTDVSAAQRSGLDRIETTRRASELRSLGLIQPLRFHDGELVTALLPTGRRGMVCRITQAGILALRALDEREAA